jgi:hypothetical protein
MNKVSRMLIICLSFLLIFSNMLYADTVISLVGGNGSSDIDSQNQFDYKLTVGSEVYDNTYLKFTYLNEGHIDNHHRDLLGGLVSYRLPIWNFISEVEIGPVLTFDTTYQNNKQTDDKNFGVLASVAIIYHPDFFSENTNLRFEWDKIFVETYDSSMYLIGIDVSLDSVSKDIYSEYSVTIMLSDFITNITNSNSTIGGSIDIKKLLNKDWSTSVGLIHQGRDEYASRPIGLTAMLWRDFSLTETLQISTGVGMYYAQNELDDSSSPVNAIISIQPSYKWSNRWDIVGGFSRIVNPTGKNFDADMFSIGIRYNL